MGTIYDPVTGRSDGAVEEDTIYNPITGRAVAKVEDGVVKSVITGKPIALAPDIGGGGTDAPVVTQPAPAVSLNSSTGVVTASYTPVAGLVQDTAKKSGTLQLTAQGAQTITPGTSNKTIAAGRYLTGVQTIKGDAELVAGNIKKGVEIFGVTGSYEGGGGGLAAVTSYTPAYQNITSLQLSGMGVDEMSGSDFSAANGTYNVTSATASLPADKKVFKHSSAEYYITYLPESTDGMYYSYGWCLANKATVTDPWGVYMIGPKDLAAGTSYWQDEMGMTSQNVTISNLVQTEVPAAIVGRRVTGYTPETLQYTFDSEDVAITGYDYEPQEHSIYSCNGTRLVGESIGNEGGNHLRLYIPWRDDTPVKKVKNPRNTNSIYCYVNSWKYPSLRIYDEQISQYHSYTVNGVACCGSLDENVRTFTTTDWYDVFRSDGKIGPVPPDANRKWSMGVAFSKGNQTNKQRMFWISGVATFHVEADWTASTAKIVVYNGDTAVITYTNSGLSSGWHHAVLTYDYDTNLFILYVDGVKRGEYSFVFERSNALVGLTLGNGHPDGNGYRIGYICEFKLWDITLTAAMVSAEYQRVMASM